MLIILFGLYLNGNHVKALEKIVDKPLTVKLVLQRVYLDGELSEEVTNETILSMEDFWAAYDSWQLIDQSEEKIVLQQKIDDISPLLKTNGYFGIDGDGVLSLFNGKPETQDVIQSFFQIDVKKLESRKHDELIQGIRIHSKDQYLEVLKTYEAYSKTEKK
ncbi:hypothetical protein WQ54_10065 [Bacillus sp. SA1-12]|nr:hypothetical protein WQ54_10065 [Bacillus sp. SA1-12]